MLSNDYVEGQLFFRQMEVEINRAKGLMQRERERGTWQIWPLRNVADHPIHPSITVQSGDFPKP